MKYLIPFIIALLTLFAIIRYTDRLTDNEFIKRVPGNWDVMTWFVWCITPRGDRINSWQSVTAYANPRVFSLTDCQSHVRTCQVSRFASVLSGSYQHPSCQIYIPPKPLWRSCQTPRWVTIADGRQILAYQSRISTTGVCKAEARICNNGVLWWWYQYRDCSLGWFTPWIVSQGYTVSNPSTSTPFVWAKKYPQELIQPTKPDLSGKLFDTDGKRVDILPNRPDEWNNTIKTPVTQDRSYLDVFISPELPKPRRWQLYPPVFTWCISPRWEKISLWLKVQAYEKPFGTKDNICQEEIRQCVDWKLNGTYLFAQCLQTDLFTDQLNQQIARDQEDVFYNQYCETPWRTQVRHWEQILAYKSLSVTQPQWCEAEIRTCRKWVLQWSYQYSQCITVSSSVVWSWGIRWRVPNDNSLPKLDPYSISRWFARESTTFDNRIDALWWEIRLRADQLWWEIRIRADQLWDWIRITVNQIWWEIRLRADQVWWEIRIRADQIGDEIRLRTDQAWWEIRIRTDQMGNWIRITADDIWWEIRLRGDQLWWEIDIRRQQSEKAQTQFNNRVSDRRDQFWDWTRGN